jgi:monovalent cation:proton antiporter-2 (CPA2) family protein
MELSQFLLGAFVYLTAAVLAAPIAARLGLGSVLGYLMAGILIGPAVLNLVGQQQAEVMHFAEFGVIVMLFLVGLELQPAKLWSLRKPILGLGGLQVAATAAAVGIAAFLLIKDWKAALCIGLILAMSSTAIVVQSLNERRQMQTSAGQSIFSVLLFQDISVIPMLALLPLLAVHQSTDNHSLSLIVGFPIWAQTLIVLAVVAGIVVGGRYLMRPLFRYVAQSGIREIFVAFAILIVVGITLLMQLVGLSAALGTFLAGVVLAESEYRHELEMDLDPFKGLLLAVFFMAVGGSIDFALLMASPASILAIVLGFILVKLIALYAVARLHRLNAADSAGFAFNLAQGGEFAFVLVSFCLGLALITGAHAQLLVAIVAMSMALAPLLMMLNDRVIQPRFAQVGEQRSADTIDERARVIIAGHGRFGMTIGRILQAKGYSSVVLDHDAEQIDALRKFGFRVFYGDASRIDLLEAAGAGEAEILVIAVDDREKILEIAATAHKHFPRLRIFARSFDRVHAYDLLNAGIDDVYREVFSSSVDMGEDVLVALGQHPFEAHRAARTFRNLDEQLMREAAKHRGNQEMMVDIARRGRSELSRILEGDRVASPVQNDDAWQDEDGRS